MLKVLNRVDILELINRQKLLDEKFNEKNKNNSELRPRNKVNTLIALNTELGEVMQDTKSKWNFWKINCKFDKEHTLEEISDYLHFLLQYIYSDNELFKEIESRNDELNATFEKHIEELLKKLLVLEKKDQMHYSYTNNSRIHNVQYGDIQYLRSNNKHIEIHFAGRRSFGGDRSNCSSFTCLSARS